MITALFQLPALRPISLGAIDLGPFLLANPEWLGAGLLLILLALQLRRQRSLQVLVVPFSAAWHQPGTVNRSRWPAILAIAGLALLFGALSRPQEVDARREVSVEGYDLVLAIDLSGSMLAEDYELDGRRVNRLQAIKPVIQAFINRRPDDRIGLVVFSGRAYTLAPLTFDHDWLARQTERLKIGLIEDGTAIGDGLGVALTRLEQAGREVSGRRQGAFIVLLTDGANNRGLLTPEQAGAIAESRGIPVYAIGAGQSGFVPFPVFDENGRQVGMRQMLSDIDETALLNLASQTGGKFFRAYDTGTVEAAFEAIDQAEKIDFQAQSYLVTRELFPWAAVPGFGLLLTAALLVRRPGLGPRPAPSSTPAAP